MEIQRLINDTEQHMAVVHAKGFAESPIGPYRNEYAYFLTFNGDGTKVTRVDEFVDSAFSTGFMAKLQEYAAAAQKTA